MDAVVSTHTFLTMITEECVCFMSCEPIFIYYYSYMVHTECFYLIFINWTVRMSDNLPQRVQIMGHAHIICITVRESRIICCQIFCDLLLKSDFERIFNVMQLISVKITTLRSSTIGLYLNVNLLNIITFCIADAMQLILFIGDYRYFQNLSGLSWLSILFGDESSVSYNNPIMHVTNLCTGPCSNQIFSMGFYILQSKWRG